MKINKLLAGISFGFLAIAAGGFAHAQTLLLDITFDASNTGTTNTGTAGGSATLSDGATIGAAGTGLLGGSSTALNMNASSMGGSGGLAAITPTALSVQSFTYVIWYDSASGEIGNKARLFDSTEGASSDLTLRGGNVVTQTDSGDISLTGGQSTSGPTIGGTTSPGWTNGTGVWTFVAVTYTQDALDTTGTTDYYTGTTTSGPTLVSSVSGAPLTAGAGNQSLVPIFQGAFDIGNRVDGGRAFDGYLSDMQLYGDTSDTNGALTSTQLTAVYDADLGIGAVPEPSTLALVAAGAIGLLVVAKRRRPLGSQS